MKEHFAPFLFAFFCYTVFLLILIVMASVFEMQKLVKDTTVTIYRPVYITETYHIYQSKMNYE